MSRDYAPSLDASSAKYLAPAASIGKGLLVALLILLSVEFSLHSDAVLHRLRSVFAAGRAMDKVLHVETTKPELLIIGNSRADNGFDPRTVVTSMHSGWSTNAFNLGLPGADARVLAGILARLDQAGVLGGGGIKYVVLSLDEALLQEVDTLGQEVFFAKRSYMLEDAQYLDFFRSILRLYGYSDNFRQLRDPGTLSRFLLAARHEVDPVGGSAEAHAGYRAGFGELQNREAVLRQEAGSSRPPADFNLRNLWRMVEKLQLRGVRLAVVFPPLLNRNVLYLSSHEPKAAPYRDVLAELRRRHIPVIILDHQVPRDPGEFINAGHLNNQGAQRYSAMLGQALMRLWPDLGRHDG